MLSGSQEDCQPLQVVLQAKDLGVTFQAGRACLPSTNTMALQGCR